ncbi:dihydroxyacetone kinase [Penicillium brasilianum]|uniref:Dihydroxyacetone kinase n=1 Tax=Penicillium brasilianum TaxID=104259 RepID=A0A1S9RV39_PENBI|nr:dihydroxyacetone kinase [Penicillium brasilianum]
MSNKHYFPSTGANSLVPRALRALVSANSHLTLDIAERVVSNAFHDDSKVSIISGGGSGHEPAWSGYVGDGLLSAVACGDIFASPSAKQILAAIRMAPSKKGVILLITNYTGDRLHFGLAAERAKAEGLVENIAILHATDDVSIGRGKNSHMGRRGLPGHVFTMKIIGAAAAEGHSFEQCLALGQAINDQTVTIASALDHCHVPGRAQQSSLSDDVVVIGAGIHNEPGQLHISPAPSVEELIESCLKLLCDESDAERGFVKFERNDEIGLLVNNYGGLSVLELNALADEVQTQLSSQWNIKPCRTLFGAFETSLNAPGFSISLCNLTAAARQSNEPVATLIRQFDSATTAVSWPNTNRPSSSQRRITLEHLNATANAHIGSCPSIQFDPLLLETAIRASCERAIAAEPRLTQWDMVMGDGDCGEAVQGLAESILQRVNKGCTKSGDVLEVIRSILQSVDDMGGTLGAIFGVLLSAFLTALRRNASEGKISPGSAAFYATALGSAVTSLKSHTGARIGDRTVMDVLLPFEEEFSRTNDLISAVKVAAEKAEVTRYLKAKFGRATYVGEASSQELPDPGAWAFYEIVAGLADGLGISSN